MDATTTRAADGPPLRGVDRFIAERSTDWAQLTDLVRRAGGSLHRLGPEDVLALGEGYGAVAADLARARPHRLGPPIPSLRSPPPDVPPPPNRRQLSTVLLDKCRRFASDVWRRGPAGSGQRRAADLALR